MRADLFVCLLAVLIGSEVSSLPSYLTDFQGLYPEDFGHLLRQAKRQRNYVTQDEDSSRYVSEFNRGEHPKHEGDLRERYGLLSDISDLDPRAEYADSNLVKALNGEKMRVTGLLQA